MTIRKHNDAKGFIRGAGTYSKSYPDLSGKGSPDSKRNLEGIINDVGFRNYGLAAPVSSDKRGDKDGDRY